MTTTTPSESSASTGQDASESTMRWPALSSCWNFRPSALRIPSYAQSLSRDVLFALYHKDNARAMERQRRKDQEQDHPKEGTLEDNNDSVIPPKPHGNILRTLQWNVHGFSPSNYYYTNDSHNNNNRNDIHQQQYDMMQAILDADADVIVLNEYRLGHKVVVFGSQHPDGNSTFHGRFERRLREEGYTTMRTAQQPYPTFLATKCRVVDDMMEIPLSYDRSALVAAVEAPGNNGEKDSNNNNDNDNNRNSSSPRIIHVAGTHLDYADGEKRLQEMKTLCQRFVQPLVNSNTNNNNNNNNSHTTTASTPTLPPTLILGDLNQQRAQDYSDDEWQRITQGMAQRNAPPNDGVAHLLGNNWGFTCAWNCALQRTNWWTRTKNTTPSTPEPLPPSTHWTGTIVDYSYGAGGARAVGCFISPFVGLSDHRMTVVDWEIDSS